MEDAYIQNKTKFLYFWSVYAVHAQQLLRHICIAGLPLYSLKLMTCSVESCCQLWSRVLLEKWPSLS